MASDPPLVSRCAGACRSSPSGAGAAARSRRDARALPGTSAATLALVLALAAVLCAPAAAQTITGLAPQVGTIQYTDGAYRVPAGDIVVQIIGTGLDLITNISFTSNAGTCVGSIPATISSSTATRVVFGATLSPAAGQYFICLGGTTPAATDSFLGFFVDDNSSSELIPLPIQIVFIIILLLLSGTFSGLNLGLMALDNTELKIVSESGTPEEQGYAKKIMPIRARGNLLLCTVLLGNVLVNSTLTILLDGLTGGLGAILGSTFGIVVFGEIIPQSVCSRHGLFVGAKTIWLTKFFMAITFPVAWPISKLLDFVLGDEVGAVYQRRQLVKLLQLTHQYTDMDRTDIDMLTGALTFKDKNVESVMTQIDDVFMLDINSVLDFKTMTSVVESGHSRIPVYRNDRHNIVGVLFFKDLAFVDPDDKIPLESIIKFYNHKIEEVYNDTSLNNLLEQFKQGRSHMVLVNKIVEKEGGDPERLVVGIATLEDLIEEIIQSEIVDETDKYMDNRSKSMVKRPERAVNVSMFKDIQQSEVRLPEQLALASYTFLSTQVSPFMEDKLHPKILHRLLSRSDLVREIIAADASDKDKILYESGKPSQIFTLVLEGHLKMTVGREQFSFDSGPFTVLGAGALSEANLPYVADYTVTLHSDRVLLFQISRARYREAVEASVHMSAAEAGGGDGAAAAAAAAMDGVGGAAAAAAAPAAANAAAGQAAAAPDTRIHIAEDDV